MESFNYGLLTEGGPTFGELWHTWEMSNSPSVYARLLLQKWGIPSENSKLPGSKDLQHLWKSFSSPTAFGKAVLMRWGNLPCHVTELEALPFSVTGANYGTVPLARGEVTKGATIYQ